MNPPLSHDKSTETALTVSELTQSIQNTLEGQFQSISLQGEISNFKRQSSGHLYFSLKDSHAQISAVMFRGAAQKLTKLPKDGDQVVVKGNISVYPPHGKYQLVVHGLKAQGLGELLLELEKLKVEVHKRGWFSQKFKKKPPKIPKRIGVVTSPTGAVIQDILHVLKRRFSGFQLVLNPVKVQGEGAAEEIAQAIESFNTHELVDVMIIGRGGGSIEDLWAFNEERVAHAVFHSKVPIIAAIGHETDHTIADYVADLRAPTPSAAAELVITEKAQEYTKLRVFSDRIHQTLKAFLQGERQHLRAMAKQPVLSSAYGLLARPYQQLDEYKQRSDQAIKHLLQQKRVHLEGLDKQRRLLNPAAHYVQKRSELKRLSLNLDAAMKARLTHLKHLFNPLAFQEKIDTSLQKDVSLKKEKLSQLVSHLEAVNPKNLIKKGYSILFSEKDGKTIVSTHQLSPGEKVRLHLSDGTALATINETAPIVTKKKNKDLSFEEAFSRLEDILEQMNTGQATLDESLQLYEEADQLITGCGERLQTAEQKIEMLVKKRNGTLELDAQGAPMTAPFSTEETSRP